ncbi:hypothetical protein NEUTE1DRAFT_42339 [Neurospora tetrasperma FGSC 2508]|uniref:Uncharacterized protein n=1 Tax=Neurospora tetrasperma (strain FGSC 2508 / ATCC MYA-4615 / P0657) TaxID=510951 RepID=F8MJQ0_NEUT8|nr:uncharacterized protein NEUTE1DRAFT_42339 [Neurospora tetrasperma FGSC 2508]EGO57291.1 hypothetical protein NEUTE1DRAFT_42339 [Neurospora tetrasperma FGSC 2508]EGZ72457.1 hypothetical protein NEUTE2DRAFT_129814 [Neurospora tetrasperma FGSC 2509]
MSRQNVASDGELQSSIAANTDNRSIISCRQPYLQPSGGVRHNLLSSDRVLKPLTPQGSSALANGGICVDGW